MPLPSADSVSRPMSLNVTATDGFVTLVVGGDLDTVVAVPLHDRILDLIVSPRAELVLDLSAVTFCGAAILRVLLQAADAARAAGVRLVLVADQRAVLRPIQALGLQHRLDLYRTLDAAREALTAQVPIRQTQTQVPTPAGQTAAVPSGVVARRGIRQPEHRR